MRLKAKRKRKEIETRDETDRNMELQQKEKGNVRKTQHFLSSEEEAENLSDQSACCVECGFTVNHSDLAWRQREALQQARRIRQQQKLLDTVDLNREISRWRGCRTMSTK